MLRTVFLSASILFAIGTYAQKPTLQIIESGKKTSMRGLSVVTDKVIWVSGSGGNIARSTDGGNTFTWMKVPGYEKMDFRDIEAFDKQTAVIMGITNPAVILKTKDGGQHWSKVFEDTAKGAFLDAMDFDGKSGFAIGDPIDQQKLYMLFTPDQGDTWTKVKDLPETSPKARLKEGEAFFASSGTNIKKMGHEPVYVSGGTSSNFYFGPGRFNIPIMQGKETTGANSLAVLGTKAMVVGGDFAKDTISSNNSALIDLAEGRVTFSIPQTPPHGYRSCVIYLNKKTLVACGTSGIDISTDGGNNWELVAKDGFHVCQKAKKGKAVFLAGNGKIAKLVF